MTITPRAPRSLASSARPCRRPRPRWLTLGATLTLSLLHAAAVHAQTWSASRTQPVLRQIASVDATGDVGWPYGREDVAGDGAALEADEAAVDVRTVYADADVERVWLRVYVAAQSAPPEDVVVFFFVDADDRDDTGGPAFGAELSPLWSTDPSDGGYERAIGVRIAPSGMPEVLGVFGWSAGPGRWTDVGVLGDQLRVEAGVDEDPIRIGARDRGYVQVDAVHALTELTASCAGNLFVRTFHDAAPRSFGDDDEPLFACRPALDARGDPEVLEVECTVDDECPNDGVCRAGGCLFAYPCDGDDDCAADERCEANACVRVVDEPCVDASDCDGLVCADGECTACRDSGAAACPSGQWCSPNGECVDEDDVGPAPGNPGDQVRGGAFHCALSRGHDEGLASLALWLAPLALLLRSRRRRRGAPGSLALVFALLTASEPARAEDLDTQRFLPHATSGGFLQTEGSAVRHPIDPWSLGLWLSYGHNPLIVVNDDEVVEEIIGHQLAFDLTTSYAFARWFELGLHLPLAYLAGDDVSEATLGDLRLLPKFRLLDDQRDALGLALLVDVRAPTHTSAFYGGARLPAAAPRLLVDHLFGLSGFRLGLDLGVLLRKSTEYRNVTAGSELQAGLGMGYRIGGTAPVEVMLDLRSAVGLADTDAEEVGLEGLLGAGIDVTPEWKINAGAGLGLLEGFGVPTARAFFGVRWQPSPNDPDHDGVRSPEPNERDEPVVISEEEQAAAGDDTGAEEPASVDEVDDAERARAIEGGYDACPDLPEDFDGMEDEDGCPEGDSDKDGVLDYMDRCPDEQETINGFEDDDGCEDEGPAQIVIEEGKLTILETIQFEPNSSKLDRRSDRILEQIALTLRKHDEITRVEIGGHTDSTGGRGLNMRLSRERARSVRQFLLSRGLPPGRVSARGYGPDKPVADNATDAGRAQNRRVEFLLVH
jgi:OOP family OmpA-OmpF porin